MPASEPLNVSNIKPPQADSFAGLRQNLSGGGAGCGLAVGIVLVV